MAGSDEITETLLAQHTDTVALVGFLDARDEYVVISADREFTRAMTFSHKDVVIRKPLGEETAQAGEEAAAAATDLGIAARAKQVILIDAGMMRAPILEDTDREKLAASFLTGPIGEGAEVLVPGTLEGAAWRLGLAHSMNCPFCSLPRRSPFC